MHLNCSCSKEHQTESSPPTRERWGHLWGPRWTGWSRQWSGCCRSWSSCLPSVRTWGPPVAGEGAGRFDVGRRSYFDFLSDQFYQRNNWDCGLQGSQGTQPRSMCWPPGSRRTRPVYWCSDRRLWLGSKLSWLIVSDCCWCTGAASHPFLRDSEGLGGWNLAEKIRLFIEQEGRRWSQYLLIVDVWKQPIWLLV